MHNLKNMFFAVASSALLLICVPACGDDGGGDGNGDPVDAGPDDIDGGGFVCDPVGANSVVGGLVNAPLDSDVEVIVKVPAHPGDPGPDNLP